MRISSRASRSRYMKFHWYFRLLQHPVWLLLAFLCLAAIAIAGAPKFRFDASSDTLVVQGDPKLLQYQKMAARFGGDDFVVLTYHDEDLLSDRALVVLADLQARMANLPGIETTYSILDAPLINSPSIPLDDLAEGYLTLVDPEVDRDLARQELTSSPLFSNYLISEDGNTTAISGTLKQDPRLQELASQRAELSKSDTGSEALLQVEAEYTEQRAIYETERANLIDALREIRNSHPQHERIFISGVPMIAADMLSYVKSDLQAFGSIVLILIIVLLYLFFRKLRWVVLPLIVCIATVIITIGLLGHLNTPVTVVSSNFIALLAIISISFSVHLVVRYRELLEEQELSHNENVLETMKSKFAPCLYTALTTLLAFGSMLASSIVPVVDFGWMMCLGIVIAFFVTYILFPSMLLLIGGSEPSATLGASLKLTGWFQELSIHRGRWILLTACVLTAAGIFGATKLTFDNRFVDYFHEDTDIRRGMEQIDKALGGTLPLDVYVRFEPYESFDDGFSMSGEEDFPERYWYTPEKVEVLNAIQDHLKKRPEIGKVLSLASVEQIARNYNDGEALSGVEIAYLLGQLPPDVKSFLIDPYSDPASGWMRLNARIAESQYKFSKTELVNDINTYLTTTLKLEPKDVVITGMVVLFNDMLNRLADSQISTLGYVIGATFFMFALLLRSVKLAVIALLPNLLAALLILAFMGYAGISLDMMTVTMAAICIGIGVDDAIHYLHRFKIELANANTTAEAVAESHQTIGKAMYFTTMTIMGGFSILAMSNFVPTVYFGLLTSLAMGLALLANLVLLPSLLMVFCSPDGGGEKAEAG